jgi:hypothetical protein
VSAKRSGWHRAKAAAIDDALLSQVAVQLISWDDVDSLYGEYRLRALAALNDPARSNEPAVIRARRRKRI